MDEIIQALEAQRLELIDAAVTYRETIDDLTSRLDRMLRRAEELQEAILKLQSPTT